MNPSLRPLALVSLALLAPLGCATVESRAERAINAPVVNSHDLAVTTRNGSIEVVIDPTRADVLVEASIRAVGANLEQASERVTQVVVQAEERDGRLTIEPIMPGGWRSNDAVSLRVVVPMLDDVSLVSSNGALTVAGATGRAELKTSNGAVAADAIRGEVVASSSNGAIQVVDSGGGVSASTSNGRIEVRGAPGPVDAATSNGRIELEDVGGPIVVRTSNGRVTIRLRSDFAGSLQASTSNGKVTLEPSAAFRSTTTDKRSATVEFVRPGPVSQVRTSNGSVDIAVSGVSR